jgi:membrane protein required for colicin V production
MNISFGFLDVAVVAIVLISAIYATYKGLVAESLAIFGWVAAAYATLYFGPWCAYWMSGMISPDWLGEIVGYAVVFLVVLLPLAFASSRISDNVKKSQVGTLDSVLGTGFGILRGVAIVGIAYLIFTAAVPLGSQPEWVTRTRLMPVIRVSAEIVASLIPDQNVHLRRHRSDPIAEKLQENQVEDRPEHAIVSRKPVESEPVPAPRPKPAKHTKKAYGAKDRRALDRLIENTDSDTSGKP